MASPNYIVLSTAGAPAVWYSGVECEERGADPTGRTAEECLLFSGGKCLNAVDDLQTLVPLIPPLGDVSIVISLNGRRCAAVDPGRSAKIQYAVLQFVAIDIHLHVRAGPFPKLEIGRIGRVYRFW